MIAFLFTLALFFFWTILGVAVIAVFNPRLRILQSILVSPALGISVTILPVFLINRLGLPVKDFGFALVLLLGFSAVLIIALMRPNIPYRRLFPYLCLLVVALLLVARPMLNYGFDWVSFSNDDMANYSLAAQRFLNHGYFEQPNLAELHAGSDYSAAYWFMHVAAGVRSGSELMLATVWAFTGWNSHKIFMPVIMALHLALVAGVGSIVAGFSTKSRPLIAMGLTALSPLTSLGALYQLIGQVGGLSLLTVAVTLTYRPANTKLNTRLITSNIPAILVFAAIFVWYPEVLPFFGLGWILFVLLNIRYRITAFWRIIAPALIIGAIVLLVLNKYVFNALIFMFSQASGGMQSADLSSVLFPYFLVPTGVSAFWGLIPIFGNFKEPYVSLSIATGIFLFYWLGREVIPKQIRSARAAACMLLVMLGMGLLLFFRNNDFGLFKLAMFAQPFLAAVVAIELQQLSTVRNSQYKFLALTIVLSAMIFSQIRYVGKSSGEEFGGLNEIPHASAAGVNRQFDAKMNDNLRAELQTKIVLETSNIVLAKFQALYLNGTQALFPSRNFFKSLVGISGGESDNIVNNIDQFQKKKIGDNEFEMLKPEFEGGKFNVYVYPTVGAEIFNAYSANLESHDYFVFDKSPYNRLQFIHSKLGNHYYLGDRHVMSFYQLENDPMFPERRFAALGRHILFRAVNPTRRPRVVLELTSTIAKQFGSMLPQPKLGNTAVKFVGRGSGRIFSSPIEFTLIDGIPYVALDMGREGRIFSSDPKGLMMLFGREIPADQRQITTFGRDISLLSEDQFQALVAPSVLQNFPTDLKNKNLEYSGIYEDGWVSENSFYVLTPEATAKTLVVSGSVPLLSDPDFSALLTIRIDGVIVGVKKVSVGSFGIQIPISNLLPKQRVDIQFSAYQKLPGADGRATGGRLDFIGFK